MHCQSQGLCGGKAAWITWHFPLGSFLLVSSVKKSPFCVIPSGTSFGHQLNRFIKSREEFLCDLRQAAREEELPPWGFESVSRNSSTSPLLYVRVRGVLISHTLIKVKVPEDLSCKV